MIFVVLSYCALAALASQPKQQRNESVLLNYWGKPCVFENQCMFLAVQKKEILNSRATKK
jgi:hypothetical protein